MQKINYKFIDNVLRIIIESIKRAEEYGTNNEKIILN